MIGALQGVQGALQGVQGAVHNSAGCSALHGVHRAMQCTLLQWTPTTAIPGSTILHTQQTMAEKNSPAKGRSGGLVGDGPAVVQ